MAYGWPSDSEIQGRIPRVGNPSLIKVVDGQNPSPNSAFFDKMHTRIN